MHALASALHRLHRTPQPNASVTTRTTGRVERHTNMKHTSGCDHCQLMQKLVQSPSWPDNGKYAGSLRHRLFWQCSKQDWFCMQLYECIGNFWNNFLGIKAPARIGYVRLPFIVSRYFHSFSSHICVAACEWMIHECPFIPHGNG